MLNITWPNCWSVVDVRVADSTVRGPSRKSLVSAATDTWMISVPSPRITPPMIGT